LFAAVAALTVALAAGACSGDDGGSGSGDLTKVNFGYIGDFNGTNLLALADAKGMWKEHGLDAKTSVFTNGPLQIDALGTGDLDFGYIGPGAFWLPAEGKAKVIAMNTLGNADRVIAQPGVTSMADLRGKTIGVPQGTSGDMILTLALKKAGMTKNDVKVVNMDAATIVSAFVSKKIDAAGFWYPAISTIKTKEPQLVELAKDKDFADTVAFPTAFVASNTAVTQDKATVQKVIAVLREAIEYRSAHLDEAIKDTAKMLGLDEAQIKADAANSDIISLADLDKYTQDGTIAKWLKGMNDYFVEAGELKAPVDPSTYYTGDLFTAGTK
jgi:NitT/TauT family transport system substrate-binding protein